MNYKQIIKEYLSLKIDGEVIGLNVINLDDYFCTPLNSTIIGYGIGDHYVFIDGYGEMVFAVNPEPLDDNFVYPIARNFKEFLGLILSVGTTNAIYQIPNMTEEEYYNWRNTKDEIEYFKSTEVQTELNKLRGIGIKEINDPYNYVMNLIKETDLSKIKYSDEYYDVLGLEREK